MKVPAKIIKNHLQGVEEEQEYKTTFKQREWLSIYLKTKNATQAAIQAYSLDPETQYSSAGVIGHENLKKLKMDDLMDAMGMTDDYLMDKVREGMEKPVRSIKVKGEDVLVADYQSRHKYVDTALKLKKKLSNSLELTGKDGSPLQIELVAGIGFLNPREPDTGRADIIDYDAKDNISESITTLAPPTGSNLVK